MQTAVLSKPATAGAVDRDRLRAVVLVRIASDVKGVSRTMIATDISPLLAPQLTGAQARAAIERELEGLAVADLVTIARNRALASETGLSQAATFLGCKGSLPRAWDEAVEQRLVAKALGLERDAAKRIQGLASPDGLRAAVLQRAYNLKVKGVATPSRLRGALAAVALERAFGNQLSASGAGKLGLSPKAGRVLAGQLAKKPRDFGTDGRLIAALAAEHLGVAQGDVTTLRLAVLRRYLAVPEQPAPARARSTKVSSTRPRLVEQPVVIPVAPAPPAPAREPQPLRPDLAGFAQVVRSHAATHAQGWSGNRRAYISAIWRAVRDQRPEWGLSEIEFKCMLTEAHRAGQLALANADLKDDRNLKDVQESAVVYKNAVFHYVRVDA